MSIDNRTKHIATFAHYLVKTITVLEKMILEGSDLNEARAIRSFLNGLTDLTSDLEKALGLGSNNQHHSGPGDNIGGNQIIFRSNTKA